MGGQACSGGSARWRRGRIDAVTATAPKLLGIYLNDHLAGAAGGLRLARRAAESNRDNVLGRFLDRLCADIEEDRAALVAVMDRLGVKPDRLKQAGVVVAEVLGRTKLNGRLASYSPLSRLDELEWLSLGIEGKASLWRSLKEVQAKLPAIADTDLDALIDRAEGQRKELEDFRTKAARQALLSD
jgi:hypothetical protein